jgi:hypothetical protein
MIGFNSRVARDLLSTKAYFGLPAPVTIPATFRAHLSSEAGTINNLTSLLQVKNLIPNLKRHEGLVSEG